IGDDLDAKREGPLTKSLKFVAKTASEKPLKDQVGLVIFGKNAVVEFPTRGTIPLEKAPDGQTSNVILNSLIDKEAINLEQGLSLAAAMLPEDKQGRIVLISDGMQTEGDVSKIVGDLKSRGITVDVLPIQYSFENEVWLERLELPQFVKMGESYEAGIVLSSLEAGDGGVRSGENGRQPHAQRVLKRRSRGKDGRDR